MIQTTSNGLCIDLEYWYSPQLLSGYAHEDGDDQMPDSVNPILDLLDRHNTKATFFVLGTVAEKYPEMVKTIRHKGHEIASHGYSHKRLHELGRKKFEAEIESSIFLLESLVQEKPIGFRAPTFSLDNSTTWALETLKRYGFKYDTSIAPVKTTLYGVRGAPLHPYKPSMDDVTREDPNGEIIEFPMSVLRLGINVPIAGGFYLRALPVAFSKLAIRKLNQRRPAIVYIHPWETYSKTPRLKGLPLFSRFVTYYGINSALRKLECLLREFEFQPIREVLRIGQGL